MKNYKISVVLPVYKVEKYILRALESLNNQTFKDFEIVLVDDCGGDNSIALAQEYFQNDDRLQIYHNPKNMGTYHARRIGVENAKGEYIIFLDPDDELDQNFLFILYEHIKSNDYEMIFYDVDHSPSQKWYQSFRQALPFSNNGNILRDIFSKNGKRAVFEGTSGKGYKRLFILNIFNELNIGHDFRYVYTEDKLLYYRAVLSSPLYATINYKGYIYHNNDTSITNKSSQIKTELLIQQSGFTSYIIRQLIKKYDLTPEEKFCFDYMLNKFSAKEIELLKRYENSGKYYFKHVCIACKISPNFRDFIRIFLYIISFKKIMM